MFDNSKKLCVFILMVPKVPKYPFYFHYTKDLEHELSHIVVVPCKDVEILGFFCFCFFEDKHGNFPANFPVKKW